MSYFKAAADVVLPEEGQHSNDPKDPGGDTWFGLARKFNPDVTPWPPSREAALAVYREKYYDNHRCDEMPWCWALAVFDGEVNQGDVLKLAQRALGVFEDGLIGDHTLAMMRAASRDCFEDFLALRCLEYATRQNASIFEHGWFKRVINIALLSSFEPSVD